MKTDGRPFIRADSKQAGQRDGKSRGAKALCGYGVDQEVVVPGLLAYYVRILSGLTVGGGKRKKKLEEPVNGERRRKVLLVGRTGAH